MYSVNNTIEDCASDIAFSLGVDEDKQITITSYLYQHFGTILREHSQYIDTLTGGDYDYEAED